MRHTLMIATGVLLLTFWRFVVCDVTLGLLIVVSYVFIVVSFVIVRTTVRAKHRLCSIRPIRIHHRS
jgi:hypothetical protein